MFKKKEENSLTNFFYTATSCSPLRSEQYLFRREKIDIQRVNLGPCYFLFMQCSSPRCHPLISKFIAHVSGIQKLWFWPFFLKNDLEMVNWVKFSMHCRCLWYPISMFKFHILISEAVSLIEFGIDVKEDLQIPYGSLKKGRQKSAIDTNIKK